MTEPKKITYHDLREEAQKGTLSEVIGRRDERARLDRVMTRRINNNVMLVGPSGAGKTALAYGWVRDKITREEYPRLGFFQFDAAHIHALDEDAALESSFAEALTQLPGAIIFIDDLGRDLHRNPVLVASVHRLYKRLLKARDIHLILTLEPQEYAMLLREHAAFATLFECIELKVQSMPENIRILEGALPRINRHRILAPDSALEEIIRYAERFPALGHLPQSAIRVLDESLAYTALKRRKVLRSDAIAHVVEAKTGVPASDLGASEMTRVKDLETRLNERVLQQDEAIARIAKTLQRAKLGLRNPNRPLGSFLMLGPSGVGKTETAKSVAELLFGRPESFVRFDMSEYQQEHTVQRLIGAPAGYVGYEEGGALTNALRKEPHALILLDEIEKAHPKVFDIFLQILDDGRITSGQNETVDARHAIFMATSNAAVPEILRAFTADTPIQHDVFIRETVMPALTQTFRLEFINRFDSLVLFKPLSMPGLVEIAQLEIKKVEARLAKHQVRFEIDPAEIAAQIQSLADPRFGARPVKRFIEETCETLLMQSLLAETL